MAFLNALDLLEKSLSRQFRSPIRNAQGSSRPSTSRLSTYSEIIGNGYQRSAGYH